MKEWEEFTKEEQWRGYIAELVKTNNTALCRAIVILYHLQTEEEKVCKVTTGTNGVGFGKVDADFLGSLAEQIMAGRYVTDRQAAIARNKVPKYWRQLMKVSKGEIKISI